MIKLKISSSGFAGPDTKIFADDIDITKHLHGCSIDMKAGHLTEVTLHGFAGLLLELDLDPKNIKAGIKGFCRDCLYFSYGECARLRKIVTQDFSCAYWELKRADRHTDSGPQEQSINPEKPT